MGGSPRPRSPERAYDPIRASTPVRLFSKDGMRWTLTLLPPLPPLGGIKTTGPGTSRPGFAAVPGADALKKRVRAATLREARRGAALAHSVWKPRCLALPRAPALHRRSAFPKRDFVMQVTPYVQIDSV